MMPLGVVGDLKACVAESPCRPLITDVGTKSRLTGFTQNKFVFLSFFFFLGIQHDRNDSLRRFAALYSDCRGQ